MFGMMRRYDADCGNDAPHEDQTTKRSRFSEEQIIGILKEHESKGPLKKSASHFRSTSVSGLFHSPSRLRIRAITGLMYRSKHQAGPSPRSVSGCRVPF
jgi:hypothetical protein